MLGGVFATVIQMSYVASLCIIVVLAVRLLMKRAPRRYSYIMWLVVLFRLLCPFALSGAVSLLPSEFFPQAAVEALENGSGVGEAAGAWDHSGGTGEFIGTSGAGEEGGDGLAAQVINTQPGESGKENISYRKYEQLSSDWFYHGTGAYLAAFLEKMGVSVPAFLSVSCVVWLTGMVLLFLYSMVSLLRLNRRLTGAVRLRENIYLADRIQTPFVLGLLRPRIYLPSTLEGNEREYIILHEKKHIRHLDHVVKAVSFLAAMLHWFNPLAWLFFVLCARDMEMACDESVMNKMGEDIRRDYSASLLNLASGRIIMNGAPIAFGEGDMKERIRNVLRYQRPAVWVSLLAFLAALGICVGLAVNPVGHSSEGDKGSEMTGSEAEDNGEDSGTEDSEGVGADTETGERDPDINGSGQTQSAPDNRTWPEGISVTEDCKSLTPEQASALLAEAQELLVQHLNGRYTLDHFTAQFSEEMSAQDWAAGTASRREIPERCGELFQEEALESSKKATPGSVWVKLKVESDWTEIRTVEDYPDIQGMRQALEDSSPLSIPERENAEAYLDGWIVDKGFYNHYNEKERMPGYFLVQIDEDGSSQLLYQIKYGEAYRVVTARDYYLKYGVYDDEATRQSGYDAMIREMRDYASRVRKDSSLQSTENGLAFMYLYELDPQKRMVTDFYFEGYDNDSRESLALADDCTFWINYEVGNLQYKKVDLDTFVRAVGETDSRYGSGRECEVSLVDGKAVSLRLMNYYPEISFYERIPDTYYYENADKGNYKEAAVYEESVLNWMDDIKREKIHVYTGNMGDGESGYITVEVKEGDIIYADGGHESRAGWNNIYLSDNEGKVYFLQLYYENRDTYGSMAYHAFTLDGYGYVSTISGAQFDFEKDSFNEEAFNLWAEKMNLYLKDTHLLLSTQDGEVRTRPVSDYELYEKSALLKRIKQGE